MFASAVEKEHVDFESSGSRSTQKTKEQVQRYYVWELHKVINESDIIIHVLNAHNPEGCWSRLVEEEVRRREDEGKKLILVLNKIGATFCLRGILAFHYVANLVPRENAQQWLRYLRHSTATISFHSASSNEKSSISSTAPSLLWLLKTYKPVSQSIMVGIVGFPNVGKSSLINSLKRSKVCLYAINSSYDLTSILRFAQLQCKLDTRKCSKQSSLSMGSRLSTLLAWYLTRRTLTPL